MVTIWIVKAKKVDEDATKVLKAFWEESNAAAFVQQVRSNMFSAYKDATFSAEVVQLE